MEKLYELRDELMKAKLNGFTNFQTHKGSEFLKIDDLINEIDNLKVCNCPPEVK
jgi:hypothetical protein